MAVENSDDAPQKWPLRKRLEFIDFRLFWNGRVNRGDIRDTFDISVQQASSDLAHYERLAPRNMVYDRGQKTYVRTDTYHPALIERSSERFLLQLVAIDSGWMQREETWFDQLPPVDVTTLKRRPTGSRVLLEILDAIRNHTQVEIGYRSLTETADATRTIAPHALFYNSSRWYARAYSADHEDFRDYNLNRIGTVRKVGGIPADSDFDYEWVHTVDLEIGPNPELPPIQQEGVAAEYGMTDNKLLLPVRLSMAFYLMSEHNLDVDVGVLPAAKQQIVLLNRPDVDQARKSFRQLSKQAIKRALGK
ncbi:transcriptional regulator [Sinorhizobium glycinis]|uniref:Transcriptional regulator n=1 Tax=Sinorhizobium glycinis TaxID=1472378 RepID=A0A178XTA2_9HYPH|nr:WYL domain-containing protein [Sinorhizobium glycinis]OAP38437.1 transcriptional regulator [Sinorhizobium glycinis]